MPDAKPKEPKQAPKAKCVEAKKQSREKYADDTHYTEFLDPGLTCR